MVTGSLYHLERFRLRIWNFLPIVLLLNFMQVLQYLWMMRENIRITVIPVWFYSWSKICELTRILYFNYTIWIIFCHWVWFSTLYAYYDVVICFLQMNPIINLQRKLQAVHLFHRMRMAKWFLHPMESLSFSLLVYIEICCRYFGAALYNTVNMGIELIHVHLLYYFS